MFRPVERPSTAELPAVTSLLWELGHSHSDGAIRVPQGQEHPGDPEVAIPGQGEGRWHQRIAWPAVTGKMAKYKTGNASITYHRRTFVQPLLLWKSNKYYIFWVCVCGFRYPACNAHALYYHPWPVRLYSTFPHYSWFQTFAVFWMLYAFFWVIHRRLNFICRRFGTLSLFHFHRLVGDEWHHLSAYEDGTDRVFRNVGI